jgi:hypothetical protein
MNATGMSCNPDPVPVSKANNGGIQWTFANAGYTFTGVNIGTVAAPTGNYGTPSIGTTPAGKSTMGVSDSGVSTADSAYTLLYTDPDGTTGSFDPTIRNDP